MMLILCVILAVAVVVLLAILAGLVFILNDFAKGIEQIGELAKDTGKLLENLKKGQR